MVNCDLIGNGDLANYLYRQREWFTKTFGPARKRMEKYRDKYSLMVKVLGRKRVLASVAALGLTLDDVRAITAEYQRGKAHSADILASKWHLDRHVIRRLVFGRVQKYL